MRTGSSRWTRLVVVTIYAAAMAVAEAIVVSYLRRLFALQYSAVFAPGRFVFPHAYLRHEQIREAATIVMLLAVAFLAGRGLLQKLPTSCWRSAYGTSATTWAQGDARLAGVAGHARRAVPLPHQWWAPVWQPLLVSSAFVVAAMLLLLRARRR